MFSLSEIDQLQKIKEASSSLKKRFKSTELKQWSASSFASELSLQTTHVLCSVINQEKQGVYIGPMKGVDKGIDDEISDVLFNIMNLINFLEISLIDILSQDINKESELLSNLDSNITLQSMNLSIQAGNLWDALFRMDGYKHNTLNQKQNFNYIKKSLAGVLISLFLLSKTVGLNMIESFWLMFEDASKFLNDFEVKYQVRG